MLTGEALRTRHLLLMAIVFSAAALGLHFVDRPLLLAANSGAVGITANVLLFLHETVPILILSLAVLLGSASLLLGRDVAWRRAGLTLFLGPFFANRLTGVLKDWTSRPRPQHSSQGFEGLNILVTENDLASFPSGHVTTAMAFVLALYPFVPKRLRHARLALFLLPLVMCWDRVALAAHFPSDAVFGLVMGCCGIAVLQMLISRATLTLPQRRPEFVMLLGLILLTAAWSSSLKARDPITLEPLPGFDLVPRMERTLFEPFVGPALLLGQSGSPKRFALAFAVSLVIVLLAVALFPRSRPWPSRRRRLLMLVGYGVLVGGLSFHGRLPADRFESTGSPGVFFDAHVHGGDPVDGAMDLEPMLERHAARGVDVIAVTNHDAIPPTPRGVPGMEWSGGLHPHEPFLHLLILGGTGAIAAALEHWIPPKSARAPGEARITSLRAIEAAKNGGAVVVVAHWWRTRSAMIRHGNENDLLTIQELISAGVDGFEVANRVPEGNPKGRADLLAIDAAVREAGLLRIATSDDHGRPAGSPCITFVPGRFDDPDLLGSEILTHLRERRPLQALQFQHGRSTRPLPLVFLAPVTVWRYWVDLSPEGRLSWILWVAAGWLITRRSPRVV